MSNKKKYLVKDVMLDKDKFAIVKSNCYLKDALEQMCKLNLGIVCIVNNNNHLKGVITDGDLRRKLLKVQKPFSAFFSDDAIDHSVNKPIIIKNHITLKKATEIMEKNSIWDLPVVDKNNKLVGLLHLHQAIKLLL